MARIKFGSIVVEGTGSLGGHTFQNSHGGAQLRTKPVLKKQPSLSQSFIRYFNTELQGGWRTLTDKQRSAWNVYPVSHGVFNKKGDKHHLSGHSLWMQLNYQYISNGLAFQTDVYKAAVGPFGDELLINGDFSSPVGWVVTAPWSIAGGLASYNALSNNYIGQPSLMYVGEVYRVAIYVESAFAVLRFLSSLGAGFPLFEPPYNVKLVFSKGINVFYGAVAEETSQFRPWAFIADGACSLDSASLRKVL